MNEPENTLAQTGGSKAKVINKDSKLKAELKALQIAAGQAREAYDYKTAVAKYSRALDLGTKKSPLPPTIEYELRSGRAACYCRMGDWKAELTDLDAIIDLAERYKQNYWEADALARKVISFAGITTKQAQQNSEKILQLSEESNEKELRALGLRSLAVAEDFSGDYLHAIEHLEEALSIYHELGDQYGEAYCLWYLSRCTGSLGNHILSQKQAEIALTLYRKLGDRWGEATALRSLGIYATDYAQRRSLTEEALLITETINDLPSQALLKNNLGLQYARIGLYDTARAYLESAAQIQRELQILGGLSFTLESLGRIYFDLGLQDQSELCFEESLAIAKEKGFHFVEATCWLGLGRLALAEEQIDIALNLTQNAINLFKDAHESANLAAAEAWRGIAYLEHGEWQNAYDITSEAISTSRSVDDVSDEFPSQDVYWLHYQVLTSVLSNNKLDGLDIKAWQTLQRAHELVFTNIASLSDAGIRRNYLNKIAINRQILSEWTGQALARRIKIKPPVLPEGNLQEQFRRLLGIGLRMNEQRDTDSLLQFILDKLIELSGAERTLIVSVDASGERQVLAMRGFSESDHDTALDETAEILDEVTSLERPVLKQEESEHDDNSVETMQRLSILSAPLFHGGHLSGIIYVDNHIFFEPFNQTDLDLLAAFSNQAASALDNAQLYQGLEQRVQERTIELQAANAELAVINRVQESLAAELDMQAIYDLVGDQIRQIFDAQVVIIVEYDPANNLINFNYMIEKGERFYPKPRSIGLLAQQIIDTRQPILLNTIESMKSLGMTTIEGTENTRSSLTVPLIMGGEVKGGIGLQNIDREHAFKESDVRLLSTLANSMSVALENARLFHETNRLLAETRQQAAELAIINSVGEAMAKQLDVATIARIVGDKVRDIFEAEVTQIHLFDSNAQIAQVIYAYDRGYLDLSSYPLSGGLTTQVIRSRQPLVLGTFQEIEQMGANYVDNAAGDGEIVESYMGVPIIVGDKVIGVVDVQSYRQNAFDDGSVRLLSTLATNMGVTIENARLFDEIKRRASEMAALTDIGRDISATLDLEAVLESITTNARDLLDAQTSAVIQLEADGETLKPIAVVGENAEEIKAFNWKLGQGIIGHLVQSGQAEQIEDAARDPRAIHIRGTKETEDVERMMVAPLTSKDGVSGAMVVWRRGETNIFSKEELDFLIGISRQASIAIQNARLFEDAQRKAREMAALTEIGREISATLDLPSVLERIATRAKDELNARDVVLRLLEPDGSLPTVVAIGKYAEVFKSYVIQIGEGLTGNVAKTGIAEMVNYPLQDPRMVHVAGTGKEEEEEDEAIIFAPLISRDKVIGVMALWRQRSEHGPFTQNDLNFLIGLARQAAIAIENARLFEEIQRQKQYSDALVETSPVAIVTTDLDGNIASWNPGAEKLFQYTQDEAIGQNLDSLVATTETMRTEAAMFSDQAKEGRLNLITKRTRKDGLELDVELAAVPVVVEEQTVGLIVIYHDITELQGARQEAETANQAKSAFLATMSHEIRTPMNAVIGMSGLLLDTELTEEQYEFVEIIRNSGDALLTIINDILDFSKIEAGKMELENQPFDLRECIEGTLDLVAGKAFEKGLDLAYLIDEQTPATFSGDMTRLRQILLNMFTNAIKFTEKGEVVLTVKGNPIRNDSELFELQFAVRDTGIGIPKERMDRLFQSFSQLDASTARKYGGTGLGLAISKRLSEMMGGRMWVESQVGEGTTFYFTIKANVVDQPVVMRPDLEHDQPQLSGRRVLIVDDNETNLRILRLQVEKWGMDAVESESPQKALNLIREGAQFEVAILDMHMPDMDGVRLATKLRQHPAGSHLPLVLFTSLGRRELQVEGVEFAAHLTKPIKPSQLFDALIDIFVQKPALVKKQAHMPEKFDTRIAKEFPLRILLTEDNAVNQKLALRLLEKMGYRADVAGNGLEALEALERQSYDVILMDVQMPEMDGLEATRQIIQRWESAERPYIIAMTANAMQGDREAYLAAGMNDYIPKPLRVEEMVAALKRSK